MFVMPEPGAEQGKNQRDPMPILENKKISGEI